MFIHIHTADMHYLFFQTVMQDQAHLTTGVIKRRKTTELHPHDSTVKHSGHSHPCGLAFLRIFSLLDCLPMQGKATWLVRGPLHILDSRLQKYDRQQFAGTAQKCLLPRSWDPCRVAVPPLPLGKIPWIPKEAGLGCTPSSLETPLPNLSH